MIPSDKKHDAECVMCNAPDKWWEVETLMHWPPCGACGAGDEWRTLNKEDSPQPAI